MARKKLKRVITHSQLGPGEVLHRILTDSGPALICRFADRTRTLLVEGAAWATGVDAVAVYEQAPDAPLPKSEPRKALKVRSADSVGRELGEEVELEPTSAND